MQIDMMRHIKQLAITITINGEIFYNPIKKYNKRPSKEVAFGEEREG